MINFNESKGNDKYKIQHRPYLQNSKGEKKVEIWDRSKEIYFS